MTECRLLVHPPAGGAWNMAVDEYLLEWTSTTGACCWRFYEWSEPTLSFGYFQEYQEREKHVRSRGCPVVRRASGGGAILHDHELTYSMTVPIDHPLGRRRLWTYETIHQTLIATLRDWGLRACLFGASQGMAEKTDEFLCFNRRSAGDVVVDDVKVAGSAQRRSAAAVLQHGSVLLQSSVAAPELTGLCEIAGKHIEPSELRIAWQERIGQVLPLQWREDNLIDEEKDQIDRIATKKYGKTVWTQKRRGRV